jgi:hypothetical protein
MPGVGRKAEALTPCYLETDFRDAQALILLAGLRAEGSAEDQCQNVRRPVAAFAGKVDTTYCAMGDADVFVADLC